MAAMCPRSKPAVGRASQQISTPQSKRHESADSEEDGEVPFGTGPKS